MSGQCSPGESDDAEKNKALDTAPEVETKLETKTNEIAPLKKVEE